MQIRSLWRHRNQMPEVATAFRRFKLPSAMRLIRAYLGIGAIEYPFVVKSHNGFEIELASVAEVKVLWHVFVRDCYKLPGECHTIIDAGGNVGIFALYAAAYYPEARIFSLEPFPSTFSALCTNINRNSLQANVRALQLGLSSSPGMLPMSGAPASTDRKIVDVEVAPDASLEWIPVVTLQEFMSRYALDTVDFLKLDIEGSEWPVILTSPPELWRRIRNVQLEYHETAAGYSPQTLLDHLALGGHSVVEHTEDEHRTGMIRSTLAGRA
jgi:FkbM family methyltransferase